MEMLSKKKGAGTRAWEVDQLRLQEWVPWEPEVSGGRLKSGPGNRGRSACGPTHVARLEFPRETGLILRCARKTGNPSGLEGLLRARRCS